MWVRKGSLREKWLEQRARARHGQVPRDRLKATYRSEKSARQGHVARGMKFEASESD